jgi:hypothetical protein
MGARCLRRAGAVREAGAGPGRLPSFVSLHQAATASSPSTPTPSLSGPFLAVGEHRVSAHLLWRPAFMSRSRVEPCALAAVSRNAVAHELCDASHRARLRKSFLAGAAAFVDARATRCSALCFSRVSSRASACRPCAHTRVCCRRAQPFGLVPCAPWEQTRALTLHHTRTRTLTRRAAQLLVAQDRSSPPGFFPSRSEHAHACARDPPRRRWLPPAAPSRRLLSPRMNLCEAEPCAHSRLRAWQAERRRPRRRVELRHRLRRRDALRSQGLAFL